MRGHEVFEVKTERIGGEVIERISLKCQESQFEQESSEDAQFTIPARSLLHSNQEWIRPDEYAIAHRLIRQYNHSETSSAAALTICLWRRSVICARFSASNTAARSSHWCTQ